jgi:hypothetical protein
MSDNNRSSQTVNLGCGTMILIALIVLIFSNRGRDDITRELRGLRTDVTELRKAVDAQTTVLKSLVPPPSTPTTTPIIGASPGVER